TPDLLRAVFPLEDDLVRSSGERDRAVLLVDERCARRGNFQKALGRTGEQLGPQRLDGMSVSRCLAQREHDPSVFARHLLRSRGNAGHGNEKHITLSVHTTSCLLAAIIFDAAPERENEREGSRFHPMTERSRSAIRGRPTSTSAISSSARRIRTT